MASPRKKSGEKSAKVAAKKRSVKTAVPSPTPSPNAWRSVTRVQLSELLGVHPDTITDFAKQGMPVISRGGQGRESSYDSVECLGWWRERQGKNAKEAAQTRAYEASAKLNELKLAQQRGELFPREQVIAEGQTFVKAWVSKIRSLARRARQAGVLTTTQQEAALAMFCRELLEDISNWKTAADVVSAIEESDAA